VAPGVNIGQGLALFEPVHGSAPDLAGRNMANPTAMLLSAVLMLRHIHEIEAADRLEAAIAAVLKEGAALTADLGGTASTGAYADAVIAKMK
jgi:isocitrate dehydrogenase (NAD+)